MKATLPLRNSLRVIGLLSIRHTVKRLEIDSLKPQGNTTMRIMILVNTLLGLLALVALSGCGESTATPQPPAAPQVTTAEVISKPFVEWNDFTGRLEAVKTVEIRPRVSGAVQTVAFKEGALIRKGELL